MKQPIGKTLMLVENCYPGDTRVRNEATLLSSAGYDVTVIALGSASEPRHEIVNGVRVYRAPRIELFKKTLANRSGMLSAAALKLKALLGYSFEYFYFTSACLVLSTYVLFRHGFDAIHAHNPPDTLFLVALPFKALGKKFVFDHHDLCPELYQSRYGRGECTQTRLLSLFEWCTLRLANVTIATNESYKQIQIERGRRGPQSVYVVRNGPGAAAER